MIKIVNLTVEVRAPSITTAKAHLISKLYALDHDVKDVPANIIESTIRTVKALYGSDATVSVRQDIVYHCIKGYTLNATGEGRFNVTRIYLQTKHVEVSFNIIHRGSIDACIEKVHEDLICTLPEPFNDCKDSQLKIAHKCDVETFII